MEEQIQKPVEATQVPAEQTKVEATPAATPFKVFTTEEEFNKAVQSERSKAKHEVLKEINAKTVEDVKQVLTAHEAIKQTADQLKAENGKLSEMLAVAQTGVLPEYVNEALVLAKAMTDKPLKDALAAVLIKFPAMSQGGPKGVEKLGTEAKPQGQTEGTITKQITSKYPWIKL